MYLNMKYLNHCLLLMLVAVSVGCAARPAVIPEGLACSTDTFTVVDDFEGARRGTCRVRGKNGVVLTIRPEDEKVINPSPWYAFKLLPKATEPVTAKVMLDYRSWPHRYWPKMSNDGRAWQRVEADRISVSNDGHRASLSIRLDQGPVWIAAQELLMPSMYDAWILDAENGHAATRKVLGKSRSGRPITVLDGDSQSRDVVLLVGRQHPPELTGAYAFFEFWETLFADTRTARDFRDRYRVIAIPVLNPDGVIAGNWRHNLGETDLNRDWGPFQQPETQLIARLLDDLDQQGYKIRAFIDFHSTKRNLFYTQAEATDPTVPTRFSSTWLENARSRLDEYEFTNEAKPTSETANGKNYMYKRYHVPSVTYEVGDETDRSVITAAAKIFADEFMQLLMQQGVD